MNTETLALLSALAPKEPEQWAVDEWMERFKTDYPEPGAEMWNGSKELQEASVAVSMATIVHMIGAKSSIYVEQSMHNGLIDRYISDKLVQSMRAHGRGHCEGYIHWANWRCESFAAWTLEEWPLIWAKKRMQDVIDSENTQ